MEPGERIKQKRKEMKLSQRRLGDLCSVSGAAVALWESGQTKLSGENLMQAATVLHTTAEWIQFGETRKSAAASDRKFVQFINENLHHLNDEERADIEKLISHAKERRKILEKYQ